MFKSIGKSLTDLSTDLREREDWEVGTLRTLDHVLNVTTFAFDPVSSILAVGELLPWFFDLMSVDVIGTRQVPLMGQFEYSVLLASRQVYHSLRMHPSNSCISQRTYLSWSVSVSTIK